MEAQFLNVFTEKEHYGSYGFFDEPGNPVDGKLFAPFSLFLETVP
jgi:hypothetical protein